FPTMELDACTRNVQDDLIARAVQTEAQRPFDLAAGPLLRTVLFRVAAEEHVLVLATHEIVCDAASLALFFNELADFYDRDVDPLATLLLGGFVTLLYRHSNQHDLTIGLPATGRAQPESDTLIGPLANVLVLRTSVSGDCPFAELVQYIHRTHCAIRAFDDLP